MFVFYLNYDYLQVQFYNVCMKNKNTRDYVIDILLTAFAALLCGTGCGFMNYASLGMDSIGTLYDGIRTAFNLSLDSIGTVSMCLSVILIIILFFIKRKYVSIGTLIYFLIYGVFANLSTAALQRIITADSIPVKATTGILGILILSFGLGIYIAVDIGVDPFTGIILLITDITHKKLEIIKIIFDIITIVIGILLGARIGALTVIATLTEGPLIAFFTKKVQAFYFKKIRRI